MLRAKLTLLIIPVLIGFLIGYTADTSFTNTRDIKHLKHRVQVLERACGPVETGGGVTQCANPPRGYAGGIGTAICIERVRVNEIMVTRPCSKP